MYLKYALELQRPHCFMTSSLVVRLSSKAYEFISQQEAITFGRYMQN
jgi:hypothetical protein